MKKYALSWLFLLGCAGDKDNQETGSEDGDNQSSDGEDGDSDTTEASVNPTILEADSWCYPGSNSGEQWMFQMFVEDPQGEDNLETMLTDAVSLYDAGGNMVGSPYTMVIYPDGSYTTSANIPSVACTQAAGFEARFIATDKDGNSSEEVITQGREGTSAAGK